MKKILFSAAVLSAITTFATEFAAVSFSSTGTDTYADGTLVPDGEMYALVWSADGNFDGLNVDGTPKNSDERVIVALPLKKGESVIVNIDASDPIIANPEANPDAKFEVLLVDTRATTGEVAGALKHVKATAKLEQEVKVASGTAPASVEAGATAKGDAVVAGFPADFPMPKITGMAVTDTQVILTVEDTNPNADYTVQGGDTPSANGDVGETKVGGGTIKLVYPKTAGSGFFKVTAK